MTLKHVEGFPSITDAQIKKVPGYMEGFVPELEAPSVRLDPFPSFCLFKKLADHSRLTNACSSSAPLWEL